MALLRRGAACLALVLGVVAPATAQRRLSESLGDDVVHETWSRGMPGSTVRRVIQTRDGYLAVATDGGLARFDGVRFSPRQSPLPWAIDSLPDLYINDVVEARDGSLWLATWHAGVVHFVDGHFKAYALVEGLPDYETSRIFEDSAGTIWVGTRYGLARKDGERFAVVPAVPNIGILSIAEVEPGTLWIGTENGLYRLHNDRASRFPLASLGFPKVLRVARMHDGSFWCATAQGLARIVRADGGGYRVARVYTARDGLRSNYISSVTEQPDGTIWAATLGGGIARLDRDGHFRSLGTSEGLADNNTFDVLADVHGNVWAGTVGGITRVSVPTLGNFRASGYWPTSIVWAVYTSPDSTVWVGTGSDGLVRIGKDHAIRTYTSANGLPSDAVFTVYRRRDGTILVGTKRGIARLAGNRFIDETARLGLPPTEIRTITEDYRGRLIVGTDTSLHIEGPHGLMPVPRRWKGPGGRMYDVTEDRQHRLWVAGGPLASLERDSLVAFRSAQGDSLPNAMDIYPDTAGIWVSDYQLGLTLIRGDSMHFFPPRVTGIPKEVLRILDDQHGSLWLTSSVGLTRVRKQDLLDYLRDKTRRVPTRLFTKFDGLRSNDFAKSGNASGGRAPDGRLWLPTTAGLVVLDPLAIPVDRTVPKVFIERIIADGDVVPIAPEVRLPRGARRVTVEFTSPFLSVPSRVRLWYKLEGVDSAWRAAEPLERSAEYENLPRGSFRFLVRAESPDGVPSAPAAGVTIVSRPPITGSPWFWFATLAAVSVSATIGYRWRVGRLRSQSAFLQRVVDERTEALAERERLESQLLHAQKLESVGRLAGGVAHDLNNLLTAIFGHAELTLANPALPDGVRADVGEVVNAAERATNLTRQLLAFARKQVVQPRIVKVGVVVQNVEKLVRRLLNENIAFSIEVQEPNWSTFADPSQIEQVVLNLALNARDAMPEGGWLRMRVDAFVADRAFVQEFPEFTEGEYVLFEVSDTGTGMRPDVMAHLFEPFFTTKEPGKGTGLGLATSYGIVTQVGGHILVDSREGEGSRFRLYFPRSSGDPAPAVAMTPTAMPRGTERILLADDEPAVRDVTQRTLRALGYIVTTANDGIQALEALDRNRGNFDLLLTDLRMPRLGGLALAATVRKRWPLVPILYMSGHSEALLAGEAPADGYVLLRKPFTASELASTVRRALETPTA